MSRTVINGNAMSGPGTPSSLAATFDIDTDVPKFHVQDRNSPAFTFDGDPASVTGAGTGTVSATGTYQGNPAMCIVVGTDSNPDTADVTVEDLSGNVVRATQ